MLPLLLLLVVAQVPAVPGETTLVSSCKQGKLSACEALKQIDPQKAARIVEETTRGALRLKALKVAEEAGAQEATDATAAEAEASSEPPDCKGQNHHIISRRIAKALQDHLTLKGLYEPRDNRFVAKAKDEESHCGYQKWHRDVDDEVIRWLTENEKASPKQFEAFLRELYKRPEMLQRFPHGF